MTATTWLIRSVSFAGNRGVISENYALARLGVTLPLELQSTETRPQLSQEELEIEHRSQSLR